MKRYLISMVILLLIALVAGIVVWYLYQDLNPKALVMDTDLEEVKDATATPDTPPPAPAVTEPITISADSLTPSQRTMLETFGVKGDITVTEKMITCAKDAVGGVRFTEIVNGGAPSPLEALRLVPCLKAQ